MADISLGNIILADTGKKGILRPDQDGRYLLNAGAFNVPNHAGITYPSNDYVLEQINANSDLQRRIKMGYCKMEVEHPEPFFYVIENGIKYAKPMTDILQWINRLRSYDPANICGLISEVLFQFENERNPMAPIWNYIRCEPFGPRGPEFKESLANPRHNTAVSIRTQISPFKAGETRKNVEYWTGYDWVSEPGMIHANKHMTAGCESFLSGMGLRDNLQKFSVSDMLTRLDEALHTEISDQDALIRVGGMEALDHYRDVLNVMKKNYKSGDELGAKVNFMDIF